MNNVKKISIRERIVKAGHVAINELIAIAESKAPIAGKDGEDSFFEDENMSEKDKALAADKLKNVAQTKKIAIFDAFEILARIEQEEEQLKAEKDGFTTRSQSGGFAEERSRESLHGR